MISLRNQKKIIALAFKLIYRNINAYSFRWYVSFIVSGFVKDSGIEIRDDA